MQNPFGLFFLLCILKGLNFRVLGHNFEVKSRARETSFSGGSNFDNAFWVWELRKRGEVSAGFEIYYYLFLV